MPLNFFAIGCAVVSAKEIPMLTTTGAAKCCAQVIVLLKRSFFLVSLREESVLQTPELQVLHQV